MLINDNEEKRREGLDDITCLLIEIAITRDLKRKKAMTISCSYGNVLANFRHRHHGKNSECGKAASDSQTIVWIWRLQP
jgi:hypothetical protein